MVHENLSRLRRETGFSQEAVAEKIGVSRQTIAKWEAGESAPDITFAAALAQLYGVSLDSMAGLPDRDGNPPGKYMFGVVRVGERGQISIPKKCREVFHLATGDYIAVLGDINRGIALMKISRELFMTEDEE